MVKEIERLRCEWFEMMMKCEINAFKKVCFSFFPVAKM